MINIPKLLFRLAPHATLGIILIVLKLCGSISWSWWWVVLPLGLVVYTLIFDVFWLYFIPMYF